MIDCKHGKQLTPADAKPQANKKTMQFATQQSESFKVACEVATQSHDDYFRGIEAAAEMIARTPYEQRFEIVAPAGLVPTESVELKWVVQAEAARSLPSVLASLPAAAREWTELAKTSIDFVVSEDSAVLVGEGRVEVALNFCV